MLSKLDHFLVSVNWEDLFAPLEVIPLARPGLDHTPLVLKGGVRRFGLRPFRFQAMWTLHSGLEDLIVDWWQEFEV